MRRFSLTTIALLFCLVSCDALPPSRPTTVRVDNKSQSDIFIAADRLPFRIIDGANTTWRPDAQRRPLCSDCDELCNSSMHADPAPTWIEISAQQDVDFAWDGRLYLRREKGCSCGAACYEVEELTDGDYQLVLEYEPQLPPNRAPYYDNVWDGLKHWRGSGLGWADPQQEERFPVTILGQPTITLTCKP